jgi:hypothetical protein
MAFTRCRRSDEVTVSGVLRPRPRPTLLAGLAVTSSWSIASANSAEIVARIKRTLSLLRPLARFEASRSFTWPRVIVFSGDWPNVGRMWRLSMPAYDSTVRGSTPDLMVSIQRSAYSPSVIGAGAATSGSLASSALRASIASKASARDGAWPRAPSVLPPSLL